VLFYSIYNFQLQTSLKLKYINLEELTFSCNAFCLREFQFIPPGARVRCGLTVSCCSSDSLWFSHLIHLLNQLTAVLHAGSCTSYRRFLSLCLCLNRWPETDRVISGSLIWFRQLEAVAAVQSRAILFLSSDRIRMSLIQIEGFEAAPHLWFYYQWPKCFPLVAGPKVQKTAIRWSECVVLQKIISDIQNVEWTKIPNTSASNTW
jgi:hypothetical protein